MAQRKRYWQDQVRIERELRRPDYERLLQKLQGDNPHLPPLETWVDVVGFMREGDSRGPQKDDLLRAIFEAHSRDHDPRWRAVLMLIFWPAMLSIHKQKSHWDRDPDELWQNINWTFLKVVCRIDITKRPSGLVQKVFNDTVHRLWDDYRPRIRQAALDLPMDPEVLRAYRRTTGDIDYEGIGIRLAQEAAIGRLRAHLDADRISEEDFLLLVGTRVYGKSAADYARETGMDYELARKRRLRAEAAIRRHESPDGDVPENPPPPPFL